MSRDKGKRKWRGYLTKDILTMGEALANKEPQLKKGMEVVVWKQRRLERNVDDKLEWRGEYEYHYHGVDGGFARSTDFLIEVKTK